MILPLPEGPTIAVVLPASKSMLTSCSTLTDGRIGYAKETFCREIFPGPDSGMRPSSDNESTIGSRSITLNNPCAAPAAFDTSGSVDATLLIEAEAVSSA